MPMNEFSLFMLCMCNMLTVIYCTTLGVKTLCSFLFPSFGQKMFPFWKTFLERSCEILSESLCGEIVFH
jgi:hypothetical protein